MDGIKNFVLQANEDNVNSCIIQRAKKNVKSGKKDFPHEENKFLIDYFNYPPICRVTKTFLEYSANDIFYTAIVGVDLLCRGELENVKKLTTEKFKLFRYYRNKYRNAREIRNFNNAGESFTSAIQGQFTNETQTYQLLSYYKLLKTYVSSIDKYDDLINSIIPGFNEDDKNKIRSRYSEIVEIMKNPTYVHLGNIKDNAILAYVDGIDSKPAFVLRPKEDIDDEQDDRKDIQSKTMKSMNILSSIEKESTKKSIRTVAKRSTNTTKLNINSTPQSPKNQLIKTIDNQESSFNKPERQASLIRKTRSKSVSRHENYKVDNDDDTNLQSHNNQQVKMRKTIDNQESPERLRRVPNYRPESLSKYHNSEVDDDAIIRRQPKNQQVKMRKTIGNQESPERLRRVPNYRPESLSKYQNPEVDDDDVMIRRQPKNQQVKMRKTINNQESSERSGGINSKRSPSVSRHINYKPNVDDNIIHHPRQNRQTTNSRGSMGNHESSQINNRTSNNQISSISRQRKSRFIKSRNNFDSNDIF